MFVSVDVYQRPTQHQTKCKTKTFINKYTKLSFYPLRHNSCSTPHHKYKFKCQRRTTHFKCSFIFYFSFALSFLIHTYKNIILGSYRMRIYNMCSFILFFATTYRKAAEWENTLYSFCTNEFSTLLRLLRHCFRMCFIFKLTK